MHYKLYTYELSDKAGRMPRSDDTYRIFNEAKARDAAGQYARYRGKSDAVLMHVRAYDQNFCGLIGRHAIEREVSVYDEFDDEVKIAITDDDDYPHTPFICFPRLKIIACVDGTSISANSAMSRLHEIISHRKKLFFVFRSVSQSFDLRKATKRFRVTQVDFEIHPVNPHTGDLGLALDQSRKLDHIQTLYGKAKAKPNDRLVLEGGLLTSVQELQQSGHCRVGFSAITDSGIEVQVAKPARARELAEDSDDETWGEMADVRILIKDKVSYPFPTHHIVQLHSIAKKFIRSEINDA